MVLISQIVVITAFRSESERLFTQEAVPHWPIQTTQILSYALSIRMLLNVFSLSCASVLAPALTPLFHACFSLVHAIVLFPNLV